MHAFAELIIFGLAPLLFGGLIIPQPVSAEEMTVSGEITFRERTKLPPGAVLTVQLSDLSAADDAGRVVARENFSTADEMPEAFEMTVNLARLQPGAQYAVEAHITANGKLWFVNEALTPFRADGNAPISLTLVQSDA